MKPIMSFWSEPYIRGFSNPWINSNAWNLSWILSVESVTKVYGKPHLYTDPAGKHFLVDELGLSFESIDLSLSEIRGMNSKFFSLGRTYAMGLQKEPFVHIDYDAYLFDVIPDDLLSEGVFFEKDLFSITGKNIGLLERPELFASLKDLPNWWTAKSTNKEFHAYKMGVFGGSNTEYFTKLSQYILQIINANTDEQWDNIDREAKKENNLLSSRVFVPQYTVDEYSAAALARSMNIKPKFMINGANIVVGKYAHISGSKTISSEVYGRITSRLLNDHPHTKEKIQKLEPNRDFELPKVSIIIIPNKYGSIYDSVLRAIIPRKIVPNEIVVSEFMLTDSDKKLLSNIEGIKFVVGGSSYLEALKNAFRKTSNQLIIVIDGHVKVPKLYIEKSIAAYIEYKDTVFCTTGADFSDFTNHVSYGALEDDRGVRPNLVEQPDAIFDIPEVSCLYGGVYIFPNKALHSIFETTKIESFDDISSLLESKGFRMRCIKSILASHSFKKPSVETVDV